MIVLQDITRLKRHEEEFDLLRQVQSRVLRHNIRNELTTIRGNAELLAESPEDNADRAEDVVDASDDLRAISRKARLVEEILNERNAWTEYDLRENAAEHNDVPNPRVTVELEADNRPTLVISDNGPGIPEQEIAALGGEHETSLEHGSGIGLWLVKWIVDRSGGTLAFDSSGDGTVVTVRFPASATRTRASDPSVGTVSVEAQSEWTAVGDSRTS